MPSTIFKREIVASTLSPNSSYYVRRVAPTVGAFVDTWTATNGAALGICNGGYVGIYTIDLAGIGVDAVPPEGIYAGNSLDVIQSVYGARAALLGNGQCGNVTCEEIYLNTKETSGGVATDYCTPGFIEGPFAYNTPLVYSFDVNVNGEIAAGVIIPVEHYYPSPDFSQTQFDTYEYTSEGLTLTGQNTVAIPWADAIPIIAPNLPDHENKDGFWNITLGSPYFLVNYPLPANATYGPNSGEQSAIPATFWGGPATDFSLRILESSSILIQNAGDVPPPAPGVPAFGMKYPTPGEGGERNWVAPPFDSRIAFQNFAFSFPTLTIKKD